MKETSLPVITGHQLSYDDKAKITVTGPPGTDLRTVSVLVQAEQIGDSVGLGGVLTVE